MKVLGFVCLTINLLLVVGYQQPSLISNIIVKLLKTQAAVIFECETNGLLELVSDLNSRNQRVQCVNFESEFQLHRILTRNNHARTAVIVDCNCEKSQPLMIEASVGHFFNKTYQWLLVDFNNIGIETFIPNTLNYFGPNAQLSYLNTTGETFQLWDIHSKGLHLGGTLHKLLTAEASISNGKDVDLKVLVEIEKAQGIAFREQFNGTTLRGATVIDRDNITTNEQIEAILSHPIKDYGVAPFSKYHYELLRLVQYRLNFTVNFRNTRGWASRLGNSTFRLGFLGVIMRNEADIGASAAFNRINRFAEFDTVHQSWKFETAFIYRFTPDLSTSKHGNFLAAFDPLVWAFSIATFFIFTLIWRIIELLKDCYPIRKQKDPSELNASKKTQSVSKLLTKDLNDSIKERSWLTILRKCFRKRNKENTVSAITLKTFAAVCQQGLDPLPRDLSSRTIVITLYFFTLVMYNYYTSSVVGGLLSNTEQGPATVEEIVSSPLKLSFEDIGYYKVLFRENKSPIVRLLLQRKLLPERSVVDLPVYTHIEDAVPHIKTGGVAFHCEIVDAYPEIAKEFDATEICDLRVVTGLMETDNMNWVVSKNSQYTEIFRTVMTRAREVGLVGHLLKNRKPHKPECQALYTVYPVSLNGVLSAFLVLIGGFVLATLVLFCEVFCNRILQKNSIDNFEK